MGKKIALAVGLAAALAVFGFWWLGKTDGRGVLGPQKQGALRVTASGYVAYALAREIGGDKITLSMLVPPGTEPHHFEPTPGAIIAVERSDVFVYVSPRVEPWVEDILKGLPQAHAVQAGPSAAGQDPHVWMTPSGALDMAQRIEQAFAQADPSRAAYYRKNLQKFEKDMTALDKSFSKALANCQSRDVVHVGHLAFGALADKYGLNLQALTGTSHQGEHSVRKLAQLVRFIRKNKVRAVFTEELLSQDLAATVARETGVQVLPLYTVEEVSKQDFEAGKTYGDYMRQNMQNLSEGLQCRA